MIERTITFKYLTVLFCTVLFLLSCSKTKGLEESTDNEKKEVDVYVTGYSGPLNGPHTAKYWKNGTVNKLSDGSSTTYTSSIFVEQSDVYTTGNEVLTNQSAIFWKNSRKHSLPKSASNLYSRANSIYVSKGITHITGVENGRGVYWRGGVLQHLSATGGFSRSNPNSIYVTEEQDIYIAGTGTNDANKNVIKYWKNNTEHVIGTPIYEAQAYSIFVSGSDVYVAGYLKSSDPERSIAKYWKNNVEYTLTDGTKSAQAKAIYVENNNVHVVGSENGEVAYWKNNIKQAINVPNDDGSFGEAISIVDGDVYIAGTNGNAGGYWKNGVWSLVEDIKGEYCNITSIFVIEKK